ncbi:MAG: hypothetical protein JRN52_08005 [Nitrososphaerota archaeon]|nr:hypothetical protein [Nitrososphaerota archaeon]
MRLLQKALYRYVLVQFVRNDYDAVVGALRRAGSASKAELAVLHHVLAALVCFKDAPRHTEEQSPLPLHPLTMTLKEPSQKLRRLTLEDSAVIRTSRGI